jgi:tetratricopeptide (TPR) repeat protein
MALKESTGDEYGLLHALFALARVREQQGRQEETLALLRRLRDLMKRKRLKSRMIPEMAHAFTRAALWRQLEGMAPADRSARREAAAMVARALSLTKRGLRGRRESALTAAALLAWTSGDRRRAETLFAEAVRMGEEYGAELLVGNALFEHGRVLGLGGESDRARQQLTRALGIYTRIHAAPAAERTQRWLDRVC